MDSQHQDSLAYAGNRVPDGGVEALEKKVTMPESQVSTAEQRAEALETALESVRAGFWEWNIENGTIRIDRQWAAITGLDGDDGELTIEEWRELCHPNDRALVASAMAQFLESNEEFLELEFRVRHKEGDRIRVRDLGKVSERDRSGRPLRLVGVRLALAAQPGERKPQTGNGAAEKLLTLIDNIPAAIYHIDATGRTTIHSQPPACLKALASEHRGTTMFDTFSMIHPEDRQMVADTYRKLKEAKQSRTLVYRIVTPEGQLRWIEDHMRSFFSDDGLCAGIDGILCDISDRISTQEEKRRIESQLRKSQRLETIGTLAGGIAHDFNNILTPILGYAEMGLACIDDDDPMHEYFGEIMQAAERAQKLVSQILTFSKAEEGKLVPVSIQEIIDEAIQLLRPSLPSTISIEESIDNSCRAVLADPTQMHQVVVNLCTNAFHAMEQNGGILKISLREISAGSDAPPAMPKLPGGDYAELSISDTGTGMDDTTVERIFEPFFTTKSIEKGTGLGLSVVHGIITAANGQLSVKSDQGKGSSISVYLPVIENKAGIKPEEKPQPARYGAKVLFIDDEPAAVNMVTIMMTKLGYNIQAEKSPVAALKLFKEKPEQFDLIITDLTMPEMTGIQLTSEIHKISPSIPVILMTGYGKIIDHDTPLRHYGINRLLKKPVKLAQLASAVNEVLSSTTNPLKEL